MLPTTALQASGVSFGIAGEFTNVRQHTLRIPDSAKEAKPAAPASQEIEQKFRSISGPRIFDKRCVRSKILVSELGQFPRLHRQGGTARI